MSMPHKPLPLIALLTIAALVLFTSGCTFRQKTSTRIRSFDPHTGRLIGSTEVKSFLSSRVAVLVSHDWLPMPEWKQGILRLPRNGSAGCAAAIDRRGYFLTASHCIGSSQKTVYLITPGPLGGLWARRARVVWQGDLKNGEPDLAVLHVSASLDHVFDWAEDVHEDEPVMAVGLFLSEANALKGFQWMGGKIFERRELAEGDGQTVLHDVPLQSGDSGGPLVDVEARLIGINVAGRPWIMHLLMPGSRFPSSDAERPDRTWLANIIETDVATREPAGAQELFFFSASKPPQS